MSKITIVGGDIIENVGGNRKIFANSIEVHSNGAITQSAKEGIVFGKPEDPPKKHFPYMEIRVKLNLFFDGTLNNKTNTQARLAQSADYQKTSNKKDDSFENDYSNIAKGFDAADPTAKNQVKRYIEGIATTDLKKDSLWDGAFADKNTGITAKVTKACVIGAEALDKYAKLYKNTPIELIVNVFGFSRGAAAARHFIHLATNPAVLKQKTVRGQTIEVSAMPPHDAEGDPIKLEKEQIDFVNQHGYFGACLLKQGITTSKITFNFVGLYDTVASYGLYHSNDTKQLRLDAIKNAKFVLQLTAADEYRRNFDLTDINSAGIKGLQFTLPGVHSDIGGSYRNQATEKVPLLSSMSKDECEDFKKILINEGWYTPKQLTIIEELTPSLRISSDQLENKYILEGTRKLFNTFDTIALIQMFHYSEQSNIEYRKEKIKKIENQQKQDPFLIDVFNQLLDYMNTCNKLRNSCLDDKTTSHEYIQKIKQLHYKHYIKPNDLKKLRNQYLHWSANPTTAAHAPTVDAVEIEAKRKRKIQNG